MKATLLVAWLAPSKFPRIVIHLKAPIVFAALGRCFKILGGATDGPDG